MPIHRSLFTSTTDEWPTPKGFFDGLNKEFRFTLDPCATSENATCREFFCREQDGLAQDWSHHRIFCNPPYGREISRWAEKCFRSSQAGALVVLLVPARTDTRWFHDWVCNKAELRFVRGRLKFGDGKHAAPFPSLVAIYRPAAKGSLAFRGFKGKSAGIVRSEATVRHAKIAA